LTKITAAASVAIAYYYYVYPFLAEAISLSTGWLRKKYPTRQYAISPQPVVGFQKNKVQWIHCIALDSEKCQD